MELLLKHGWDPNIGMGHGGYPLRYVARAITPTESFAQVQSNASVLTMHVDSVLPTMSSRL